MKSDINRLKEEFFRLYGDRDKDPVLFYSPGRVNLIGEHTDYNGGYVFPCALDFGTTLLVRSGSGEEIRMNSLNFPGEVVIPLALNYLPIPKSWTNYPVGVINEFARKGIGAPAMEMLFTGDIPNGAGLSSSASIEMVTAVAMNELTGAGLEMMEMVKMSQKAENGFVGMNCGIMDQFAVGFGRANHAINLNCDTLEYRYAPVNLGDRRLVITNTNKRRGLTDSKYNERRAECEKAVTLISAHRPVRNLSELTVSNLWMLDSYIPDPVVRKRAKHVITENGRTLDAIKALENNDIELFGRLMNESHDSLCNDYEVTGAELDTLVYEGRKLPGVTGTRMTGAGFGGCTVSIVESEHVDEFISRLGKVYTEKTGLTADFYLPGIGDGARMLQAADNQ
ncbi:MAG TPA: galactokinase [Bacteroidales bacterium]|nr:galactokinase [Bacteroidales bacterium]HQL46853.1 galactokinase [Bacteroidales bacterium]